MKSDIKISTNEKIEDELRRMKQHEIPYEYRLFGSKWLARVKLTNGKCLMVCPYRRTVTYLNKNYKYKYLERWMFKNNLYVDFSAN